MGDLRIFDLGELKRRYGLEVFFETGTLYGDGVDYALQYFDRVVSVEIDQDLADRAQVKYRGDERVNILRGASYPALKFLLPYVFYNTLFWLDAHFPGADCHKAGYLDEEDILLRVPLETELGVIAEHAKRQKDVIIIDDAWLWEPGDYEWGDVNKHLRDVLHLDITREELVGAKDASFIYDLMESTHHIKKLFNHQGYFVLEPKQ